jgi:hypothetical protein
VTEAPSGRIRPATRVEAFLRVSPSSIFMPIRPGTRGIRRLAALVERVPAYWLELGRDRRSVADCLEALLARLADRCPRP